MVHSEGRLFIPRGMAGKKFWSILFNTDLTASSIRVLAESTHRDFPGVNSSQLVGNPWQCDFMI